MSYYHINNNNNSIASNSIGTRTSDVQSKFEVVLAARCDKSNSIPSELELVLSSHRNEWCHKVRVVPSLCAGAHFIFPGGTSSKPTIALRVYEEKDILALEQHEMPTFHDTVVYLNQLNTSSNSVDENNKWHSDLDDLQKFRDSYKNSLVFFVLPVGELQIRQLTQPYSFFQMAQRILSKPTCTPAAASNQEPITPGIAARNQVNCLDAAYIRREVFLTHLLLTRLALCWLVMRRASIIGMQMNNIIRPYPQSNS